MVKFDKGSIIRYQGALFQVTDTDNEGVHYRYQLTPAIVLAHNGFGRGPGKIRWSWAATVDPSAEFITTYPLGQLRP